MRQAGNEQSYRGSIEGLGCCGTAVIRSQLYASDCGICSVSKTRRFKGPRYWAGCCQEQLSVDRDHRLHEMQLAVGGVCFGDELTRFDRADDAKNVKGQSCGRTPSRAPGRTKTPPDTTSDVTRKTTG